MCKQNGGIHWKRREVDVAGLDLESKGFQRHLIQNNKNKIRYLYSLAIMIVQVSKTKICSS